MKACYSGDEELARYLIELGADINEESKNEETALSCVCEKCHINIVKYLLYEDIDIYNTTNILALRSVLGCLGPEVVIVIIEY